MGVVMVVIIEVIVVIFILLKIWYKENATIVVFN